MGSFPLLVNSLMPNLFRIWPSLQNQLNLDVQLPPGHLCSWHHGIYYHQNEHNTISDALTYVHWWLQTPLAMFWQSISSPQRCSPNIWVLLGFTRICLCAHFRSLLNSMLPLPFCCMIFTKHSTLGNVHFNSKSRHLFTCIPSLTRLLARKDRSHDYIFFCGISWFLYWERNRRPVIWNGFPWIDLILMTYFLIQKT